MGRVARIGDLVVVAARGRLDVSEAELAVGAENGIGQGLAVLVHLQLLAGRDRKGGSQRTGEGVGGTRDGVGARQAECDRGGGHPGVAEDVQGVPASCCLAHHIETGAAAGPGKPVGHRLVRGDVELELAQPDRRITGGEHSQVVSGVHGVAGVAVGEGDGPVRGGGHGTCGLVGASAVVVGIGSGQAGGGVQHIALVLSRGEHDLRSVRSDR